MRLEKKSLTKEYVARLNRSPFFLLADYRGMKVAQFEELRRRLAKAEAEIHVVKNSVFRIAAREVGRADLAGLLGGQTAAVTGRQDVCVAAKVLKTFAAEFDRPKVLFGFLGDERLDAGALRRLADLPPLGVLRGQLLGVFKAPAGRLASLLAAPATQLARVLQARVDQAGEASPA